MPELLRSKYTRDDEWLCRFLSCLALSQRISLTNPQKDCARIPSHMIGQEIGKLTIFPAEIVLKVLEYLDGRDLARCRMVCRSLKERVDRNSATLYTFRLAMHDYKDTAQTSYDLFPTAALRLQRLEQYFTGWEHLDHVQQEPIKLPRSRDSESAQLSGGLYAYKYTRKGRNTLGFVELPSRIHETRVITWSHEDAFDVAAFAMVRSEDLLVLLEVDSERNGNLHLRTLSSNKPHPKARCPILVLDHAIYGSGTRAVIQILGDSIAVHGGDLMVWNWHSGDVLYPAAGHLNRGALLCLVEPKMLLISHFDNDESESLAVYEVFNSDLRLLVSLELPVLTVNGHQAQLRILMKREIPLLNQATSSLTPFDTSNARVLHFDAIAEVEETEKEFDLFVPVSTIVRYARSRGPGASELMKWSEWSPNRSLLIASPKSRWYSQVYGSRFAYISETMRKYNHPRAPGIYTTFFLTVIDFTPHLSLLSGPLQSSPRETTSETKAADSEPNEGGLEG
ncbi:hypothetical protein BS47DRAFT_1363133 [Hydnum rufescens UP504]|uniref:F-box domain-containing protein n=1 Tax=Hydnum rufescens UP504 TaxID=1448309 RepID=A0A9P6AV08_9AGAM|nr:hypothetical protein BS47DRAFT_1363133 [Hydnum rufescens UP504]